MVKNELQIKSYLQRLANILLINGGFLDSPGLYAGEMGLVLFFFRYDRFTKNALYKEYSFALIDKIQNSIHQETPINYKHGLSGIGSTIEYLVQHDYIETDIDEVLEEFDNRIFFTYNLPYLPVEEIMDIGYYAAWRLQGNSAKKDNIRSILLSIEHIMSDHSISSTWHQISQKNATDHLPTKLAMQDNFSHIANDWEQHLENLNLGFENGLAGLALSLLTELDNDDSWISLFPYHQTLVKNEPLPD